MTIREVYQEIGGDFDDFLNRIPKEDLAEKLVRKFAESERYDELFAAYENKDYQAIFELTHNLKGMAANISFIEIRDTMSEICESVRNGEPVADISELMETAKVQQAKLKDLVASLD